jgi:uncharacterized membrane protein (UPF0136 family)
MKMLLTQAISRYLAQKITLDTLATIAQRIVKKKQSLPHNLTNILGEIQSFYVIKIVLTEFLEELTEDKKVNQRSL